MAKRTAALQQPAPDNRLVPVDPKECTGVLIILPAYGQNNLAHTTSLLFAIGQILTQSHIPNQLLWFSMSDIIEARAAFLTLWFDKYPQYSHLLMIDSDMHADAMLIRDMLLFNKPLTGVFYSKREKIAEGKDIGSIIIGHPKLDEDRVTVTGGFMPCRHVGAGILMIKREVVRKMCEQMPQIMDHSDPGSLEKCGVSRMIRAFEKMLDPKYNNLLSEDYAFCERWQQCGGEVWANIVHRIDHIGPANYPFRYVEMLKIEEEGK